MVEVSASGYAMQNGIFNSRREKLTVRALKAENFPKKKKQKKKNETIAFHTIDSKAEKEK